MHMPIQLQYSSGKQDIFPLLRDFRLARSSISPNGRKAIEGTMTHGITTSPRTNDGIAKECKSTQTFPLRCRLDQWVRFWQSRLCWLKSMFIPCTYMRSKTRFSMKKSQRPSLESFEYANLMIHLSYKCITPLP